MHTPSPFIEALYYAFAMFFRPYAAFLQDAGWSFSSHYRSLLEIVKEFGRPQGELHRFEAVVLQQGVEGIRHYGNIVSEGAATPGSEYQHLDLFLGGHIEDLLDAACDQVVTFMTKSCFFSN